MSSVIKRVEIEVIFKIIRQMFDKSIQGQEKVGDSVNEHVKRTQFF
jgi:hypothetical protein